MQSPIHILTQMEVLKSFSVAKKIQGKDITDFCKSKQNKGLTKKQIAENLQQKILSELKSEISGQMVPGFLGSSEPKTNQVPSQNVPELNRIIMIVGEKLLEKNYDKMSLCYFINTMVNILNLSESDFLKFHGNDIDNGSDEDGEDSGFID